MYDEWDEIENQLNQLSNLANEKKEIFQKKTDIKEYNLNKKKDDKMEQLNKTINNDIVPKPSSLRVSTITALSSLSTSIDLSVVNKYLEINEFISLIDPGGNDPVRGTLKKKSNKVTKKKKMFFNQTTVIVQLDKDKKVNVKIFSNGNIQMTGLKSEKDGIVVCNTLKKELLNTSGLIDNEIKYAIPFKKELIIKDINIVLINSDYFCGYKIKRDVLHKIIVTNYKLFSSYEPCIYPGVNTKFFWNKSNVLQDGICKCTKKCLGKGSGDGDGDCKKITVSVFQSGNVIITGARNIEQINDAYNFINNIFESNYQVLKKINNPYLDIYQENISDKIIMVPKKNIR